MANSGTFKKGEKRPGQGRPKGSTNKETALIRDMVAQALQEVGGVAYLVRQAEERPAPFLALVGKTMPVQITGDPDAPLTINWPVAASRVER